MIMKRHNDEIIQRMGEPEYLRKLRRQAERIEQEQRQAAQEFMWRIDAEALREKIRRSGHTPVCSVGARATDG